MAQFDLSLDDLRCYQPDLDVPEDLGDFWDTTLAETRRHDLAATFEPVDTGLQLLESFDVTFAGFGGSPIRGWMHLPVHRRGPLPCVVQYQGYGGGRGLPHEHVLYALAGYAQFTMDTRGQGSGGSVGDTADPEGSEPAIPGFMTRGILDPATYYYRRVFTDAVRAVEAARSHPGVDASRVAVAGGSQGGGITLATAALVENLVAASPSVPFLCQFRRATTFTDADPYGEIVRYLSAHRNRTDQVFRTLSYFDGAVLASRAHAPALFSVGLMDLVCPPSTVFAAYNRYGGDKEIEVYPFNGHEGGGPFHQRTQLAWLRQQFGAPALVDCVGPATIR